METLLRDLRFGFRMLGRNPGVTGVAVVALALGIGANTAIFSVVNSVLLRPLPYRDESRLVQIWGSTPSKGIAFHNVSYSDVVDWRDNSHSFETIAACDRDTGNLSAAGGDPERVQWWRVNAGFFPMLNAAFLHGRGILPDEDRPGAAKVAVLSYGLWQRRFGSDQKVIGAIVRINGEPYTVAGVLVPGFKLAGREIDVYSALAFPAVRTPETDRSTALAFGRLKSGVTIAQAQVELEGIGKQSAEKYRFSQGRFPKVWGLRDFVVRDVRTSLLVLLGAVALVLLIACANVANLLLARAGARSREIAVRKALGASRGSLIRQLLSESMLLGIAGGALGALLAWWGVRVLVRLSPAGYPFFDQTRIDAPVLAFTLAVSVVTSIVFGLAPALASSRATDLQAALKEGGRGSSDGLLHHRLRGALVVSEVALALLLLAGAGLLIRSFLNLQSVNPGYNPSGVLTAAITLPESKYGPRPRKVVFWEQLLDQVSSLPGVEAAGITSNLPASGSNSGMLFFVEGKPFVPPSEAPIAWFRQVSTGYFRAMQIPLVGGRLFGPQDNIESPAVAIVNQTLARRSWPNQDAVGKRFCTNPPQAGRSPSWITIVGVVGDLRHRELSREPDAELFFAFQQVTPAGVTVVARTSGDATRFAPLLRRAVAAVDSEQPLSQVKTMAGILSDSLAPRRFAVFVLSVFAAVALALAAVGIYGVISFTVTRRTQEIGVRMALGAQAADVLRMVIRQAMVLAAAGIVIGLAGSLALTRVMESMLYGVRATDPLVFAAVAALLAVMAGVASFVPARRAAGLDPVVALRYE